MGPGSRRGRNPLPCGEWAGRPGQSGKGHPEALDLPGGSGWGVARGGGPGCGEPGARWFVPALKGQSAAPSARPVSSEPTRCATARLCLCSLPMEPRARQVAFSRAGQRLRFVLPAPGGARAVESPFREAQQCPRRAGRGAEAGQLVSGACGARCPFLGLPPELREGALLFHFIGQESEAPESACPDHPTSVLGGASSAAHRGGGFGAAAQRVTRRQTRRPARLVGSGRAPIRDAVAAPDPRDLRATGCRRP